MRGFRRFAAPAAACAISVVTGCSRRAPDAAGETGGRPDAGQVRGSSGNACDRKLISAADAAGILSDPITGNEPLPGDPQTCRFTTAGLSIITVTLRPRLGRTTVSTWKSGRMPVAATPLAGVGDEAAWVDELHEVVAEKNDLLCDVQVTGLSASLRSAAGTDRRKAIGELCNTIFGRIR